MRDFLQDWQRWTRIERLMAVLIAMTLLIGVPTALAVNLHSANSGHDSSGVGIAF